jgi:hypothetical protein
MSDLDDGDTSLGALADIATLRRLLDQGELAAVRAARHSHSSWAEIATNLGITRQAAWERWRELDDTSPPAERSPAGPAGPADPLDAAIEEAVSDLASGLTVVPEVVGLSSVDAQQVLESRRLVAVPHGRRGSRLAKTELPTGTVTDQTPQAGAKRRAGSSVTLWIGSGGGGAGVREPRRPRPSPRLKAADLAADSDPDR